VARNKRQSESSFTPPFDESTRPWPSLTSSRALDPGEKAKIESFAQILAFARSFNLIVIAPDIR